MEFGRDALGLGLVRGSFEELFELGEEGFVERCAGEEEDEESKGHGGREGDPGGDDGLSEELGASGGDSFLKIVCEAFDVEVWGEVAKDG